MSPLDSLAQEALIAPALQGLSGYGEKSFCLGTRNKLMQFLHASFWVRGKGVSENQAIRSPVFAQITEVVASIRVGENLSGLTNHGCRDQHVGQV